MKDDPFKSDQFLDISFDTSYEEAELWQGALRNEEDAEGIVEEAASPSGRVRFFTIAIIGVVAILLARLTILQLLNSDQNKALAEGNRIRETQIAAPRGVIYDAKRGIVARNVPNFEVRVIPADLPRKEEERVTVYAKLSEVLKKPVDEIARASESKGLRYGTPILLADKLDRDSSILLQMRATELTGIQVQNNPQRAYDRAEQYAHLIGYTGRVSEDDLKRRPELGPADFIGKTGLESVYQNELKGEPGKQRVEVNASGQVMKQLQSTDPTAGKSLILGIDPDLQNVMYDAVANGMKSAKKGQATGGSAIALNPKTGEILGMVSLPSFNNNLFIGGISDQNYRSLADDPKKPLFNRPISGEYPPGSTFKLVTATAGLGEGVITPGTYLASPPELDIQGYKFPDWNPKGHGTIAVEGALAQSSDVFFYKVAGGYGKEITGVGEEKLGEYMKMFGIGKESGIDLPDENAGLVPTNEYKQSTFGEPWYIGDTYHMGIGQGFVLTTPMQVADYTATIANGGVAYKPHLVKAIENPDNPSDVQVIKPEELVKLPVSTELVNTVKEGMRQAVQSGTARELKSLNLDICGKTGSAEFANETNSHAWFTAFAPCDNPQIVVTVMIEGGGEGADTAVPAASKIFQQFFNVRPKVQATKPPEAAGER